MDTKNWDERELNYEVDRKTMNKLFKREHKLDLVAEKMSMTAGLL